MTNEWQNFLTQHGGKVNEQGQISFANSPRDEFAQLESGCHLASLDQLGIIHVTGDDAQAFLQAQFSNDINLIDQSTSQISAYCNPKGRMLAQFLIIPADNEYYLIFPHSLMEKTLKRLRMFVLRSQVSLTDVSDEMVCLGLIGDKLDDIDIALPETDYGLLMNEQTFVTKVPATPSRHLILCPLTAGQAIWLKLIPNCGAVSAQSWSWLDIQAGLPSIQAETVEEFVPQMLNLELIGGVNFKKGCYPGQEIVARMHYLGKPKRRMFKLHTDAEQVPAAGDDLYLHGGDGQSAGKVVMAQPSASKGTDLLAVIRLNHADSTELRLGSADGPLLSFEPLPYSLESK